MKNRPIIRKLTKPLSLALLAAGLLHVPGCQRSNGGEANSALAVKKHASRKTLSAFGSERELSTFLKDLAEAEKRDREQREDQAKPSSGEAPSGAPPTQAAPEPAASASAESSGSKPPADDSVTNVQHAGVDEGGIVKVHGEHLIVLRRGRLFTVKIGDGALAPVSAVDAFGPEIDPGGTWYDEMLVANGTIAVIGYSYERGGTEIGLFDIDTAGALRYRATYHLRSNDYYSSRNYASRLIGNKLIFYTPLYMSLQAEDVYGSFPALRKWWRGAKKDEFRRIASAMRVYRPLFPSQSLALHTVTVCDLAQREMSCEATAVMGPPGRVFYVSPGSVFVWVTDWQTDGGRSAPRSLVYRLPLDGSSPSVLRTRGSPVDQFSFLEDRDGHLNVLVRAEAAGDGMWSAEVTAGDAALLRVKLESFSDGADSVPASSYHALPAPKGYTFQNRFVGDHLLYGTGSGWGPPEQGSRGVIHAYRYAGGEATVKLPLPHGVDRIEALGSDAIVVGTDSENLHFSPVALSGRPALAQRYTRKGASQGELRSHGFFYKPDGARSGLLGLPVREPGRPGYEHLFHESASILFLRNDALRLGELGALGARPEGTADDGCRASCVDWYGNARPLFVEKRVLALLGYELVEGELDEGRIRERRRVSFAPSRPKIAR